MSYCPWCHTPNTKSSGHEDGVLPEENDVMICWTCRQIGLYTADDTIRMPTRKEYEEIVADPEVRKVLGLTTLSPSPEVAIDIWRKT